MTKTNHRAALWALVLTFLALVVWLTYETLTRPRMDPDLVVEAVPVDAEGLGDAIRRAVERVEREK